MKERTMKNTHARSLLGLALLFMLACGDTGSGVPDGSAADSGLADSRVADSGLADSGLADSGGSDAGGADAGGADAGGADAGGADAGGADAGADTGTCVPRTFYVDRDEDGFGDAADTIEACEAPSGYVSTAEDCNDDCAECFPGGVEVCDGALDQNCDGSVDEACDCSTGSMRGCGDTGACLGATQMCEAGSWGACSITPQDEVCDGIDNDCNGSVDEGVLTNYYADADEDGFGNASVVEAACSTPAGFVTTAGDCNDRCTDCNPDGTETCDGTLDENCDGSVDEGCSCVSGTRETCGTGLGQCAGAVRVCTDGSWSRCSITPRRETCNGEDDDCDGDVDESLTTTYYRDADGDGDGDPVRAVEACGPMRGWSSNRLDCDDSNGRINRRAREICDAAGVDENCSGTSNEGCECVNGSTQSCGTEVGSCMAGTQTCVSGAWESCQGEVTGTPEICDDIDHDCDGSLYNLPAADTCPQSPHTTMRCGVIRGAPNGCDVESCDAGWDDCDENVVNGCEANLVLSNAHCGACNSPCAPDQQCTSRGCTTSPCGGTTLDCDTNGSCETDAATDDAHCGACNAPCGADQACLGGSCTPLVSVDRVYAFSASGGTDISDVNYDPYYRRVQVTGTFSGNFSFGTFSATSTHEEGFFGFASAVGGLDDAGTQLRPLESSTSSGIRGVTSDATGRPYVASTVFGPMMSTTNDTPSVIQMTLTGWLRTPFEYINSESKDVAVEPNGNVVALVQRAGSPRVYTYSQEGVQQGNYEYFDTTGLDPANTVYARGEHLVTDGFGIRIASGSFSTNVSNLRRAFVMAMTADGVPRWSFPVVSAASTRSRVDRLFSPGGDSLIVSGGGDAYVNFLSPDRTIGSNPHGFVAEFVSTSGVMRWQTSIKTAQPVFATDYLSNTLVIGSLDTSYYDEPFGMVPTAAADAGAFYVSVLGPQVGDERLVASTHVVGTRVASGEVRIDAVTTGSNGIVYIAGYTSVALTFGTETVAGGESFIVAIDPSVAVGN